MNNNQTGQNDNDDKEKKTKKRFKSREEKIKFYATAISLSLFFGSFTIFVFLIPFVIDPACASLRGDYTESPVECRIVSVSYILGASRCSWSSCREGCTRDIYECHQMYVQYQTLDNDSLLTHTAQLFVNTRGCGYPPEVNCTTWVKDNGINDSTVACYYSRSNSSLAVTYLDITGDTRDLVLSVSIPLVVFLSSGTVLIILHARCCKRLMKNKKKKESNLVQTTYNSSFTKVPKITHSKRSKSRKESKKEPEALPLYDRALKVENLEEYGRTNSRDELLPGAKKRSWRRNNVKSSSNPS